MKKNITRFFSIHIIILARHKDLFPQRMVTNPSLGKYRNQKMTFLTHTIFP
jgi:hypothetical protein